VTAPWSVELNQDILLVVKDNLIVVLGNDNGDRTILLLWNGLRLDAWLDIASSEFIDKFANILSGKLLGLVEWELLVLDSLLNGECRPLANLEVKVTTVLSECLCVNGSKVDLALVLLGDFLEVLGEGFTLFWGFGENIGEGETGLGNVSWNSIESGLHAPQTYGHVARVSLRPNLANQWSGRGLGELLNSLLVELLSECVLALVEGLV